MRIAGFGGPIRIDLVERGGRRLLVVDGAFATPAPRGEYELLGAQEMGAELRVVLGHCASGTEHLCFCYLDPLTGRWRRKAFHTIRRRCTSRFRRMLH